MAAVLITITLVAPNPSDPPATYNTAAYQWALDIQTWTTQANALSTDVDTKSTSASTSATNAATSATNASNSATAAAASATAAGYSEVLWVSGTTYAIGNRRVSPANLQTYVRKTAGAGTTDPRDDPTNWGLGSRVLTTVPVSGTTHNVLAFTRARLDNVAATAVTLNAAPNLDDELVIDPANGLLTNTVLRNGKKIDSVADDVTIDSGKALRFTYVGGTVEWRMTYA